MKMKKSIYILLALLLLAASVFGQANGNLNQIGDKKILHVWGDHYQRGYAQGYYLAPQIVEVFNDFYWTMFCYSSTDFYSFIGDYYTQHFAYDQRMFFEALGMAEGMTASGQNLYHNGLGRNLTTDDILLLNTVYDMVQVRSQKSGKNDLELGCASLSSWGTGTAADSLLASSGVITRFLDVTQNTALINNPIMVVHHPSESDEGKWLSITIPGFLGSLTAISESGVCASLNTGSENYAPNPFDLSPILFDLRRGIERTDYDGNGAHNPLDELAAIADGNHLSGTIIHTLGETNGTVYSSVIETRNGTTQARLDNQNGNLPTHHLAATNHFRLISGAACCTRYSNIQDSLYADSNITAKRQWRVLSGAAGLENTLGAIQFTPSTGALLWASATMDEPAYLRPALSFDLADIFSFSVDNSDEVQVPVLNDVKLYPNPLLRGKKLYLKSAEGITQIELYNLKGQKVFSEVLSGAKGEIGLNLPTAHLPKGVYLLKSTTSTRTGRTKKLVLL